MAVRTPEYPYASTFARSAIVARTARLESGSPTPAAWLRSRFSCRALSASRGIRTSANDPKPVLADSSYPLDQINHRLEVGFID